jgi:hypothetical protein
LDVRFDSDSYRLYASVKFIDPQSGSEIAALPMRHYRGGLITADNCMRGAMEKLAKKLKEERVKRP